MTPYETKIFLKEEANKQAELAANWHHPLSKGSNVLYKVLDDMQEFKLAQEDVPLIIKLTENPRYFTSKLFIVCCVSLIVASLAVEALQMGHPEVEAVAEVLDTMVAEVPVTMVAEVPVTMVEGGILVKGETVALISRHTLAVECSKFTNPKQIVS